MNLCLGTVQLGMNYGIANTQGMPSSEKANNILKYACEHGINTFDTASSYGNSEILLGSFFKNTSNPTNLRVCTKIRSLDNIGKEEIVETINREISLSLERLQKNIDYLLFHNVNDLLMYDKQVMDTVNAFQAKGLIDKIGVSVYSPHEIMNCLKYTDIGVFQATFNVFDHRFASDNLINAIKDRNIELHSRSMYLQGLLLMDKANVPGHLASAIPYIEKYRNLCAEVSMSPAELAFVFVRDAEFIDKFFVGCESVKQLEQNIEMYKLPTLSKEITDMIFEHFSSVPDEIIIPSKWGK